MAYASVDEVFWVVTPYRRVNTDIFEDLAASPSGSIPEDFDFCLLCDLPMVSALVIYISELNCNLHGGFKISCGASKGVVCYNLFIPLTYKGSTEMEIRVAVEQLMCSAYPFK